MGYTLNYKNGVYKIPPFTNAVRKKMNEINANNCNPSFDDEKKYRDMHEFIQESVGEESAKNIFGSDDFDEVDLMEVKAVYLSIAYAYDEVVNSVKRNAQTSPEDRKLVMDFLKNSGSMNELLKKLDSNNQGLRVLR